MNDPWIGEEEGKEFKICKTGIKNLDFGIKGKKNIMVCEVYKR